jgi:tRNA isopentenyl-2-thiomethyl-A-37 hydroxylase MiaE
VVGALVEARSARRFGDAAALTPDLTVALSRADADYKVYVRSTSFSEQDAAALFAVIWQDTRRTGASRQVASTQATTRR